MEEIYFDHIKNNMTATVSGGNHVAAIPNSGTVITWGGVRPWTRPDGQVDLSPFLILLWLDGFDQS